MDSMNNRNNGEDMRKRLGKVSKLTWVLLLAAVVAIAIPIARSAIEFEEQLQVAVLNGFEKFALEPGRKLLIREYGAGGAARVLANVENDEDATWCVSVSITIKKACQ